LDREPDDAALIRSLTVIAARRRQGLALRLYKPRARPLTPGSQRLYTLARADAAGYFARYGFVDAPQAELIDALTGTPLVDHLRARPAQMDRARR